MPSKLRLVSAEVTFHLHATEDEERCLDVIARSLNLEGAYFTGTSFKGHHGNEVKRFTLHMTSDRADNWVRWLLRSLDDNDRKNLVQDISMYLDEHGRFYLRLDKQRLFLDKLLLGNDDVVRVKVKPKPKWGLVQMEDEYRNLILESR